MSINPIGIAKEHFKESLTKGQILSLNEINLPCDEEESSSYQQILTKWYTSITKLDFLPEDLSNLEEIFIHGPTNMVIKDAKQRVHFESDLTIEDIHLMGEILVYKKKLSWNYKEPFVSFYAKINKQKVRISLIHYSASPSGNSKIFIRVLNDHVIKLEQYNGPQNFYKKIIDIIRLIKTKKVDIIHTHLILANKWGRMLAILSPYPKVCKTEHATYLEFWKNRKLKKRTSYLILDKLLDRFTNRIIYVTPYTITM